MNLLTLQPEQYSRINNRNVIAIQDYPRFVSTNSETIVNGTNKTFTFLLFNSIKFLILF